MHGSGGKGLHGVEDHVEDILNRQVAGCFNNRRQPFRTELPTERVAGLGKTIGIEEQRTGRTKAKAAFRIGCVLHHSDRQSAGQEQFFHARAWRGQKKRWKVTRIGVNQVSRPTIQNSIEYCHKGDPIIVLREVLIDLGEASPGSDRLARLRPQQGAGDRHEQRARNPLSDHIADGERQTMLIEPEKIVEVAAHDLGRPHPAADPKVVPPGQGGRQHGALDRARDFQFLLERHQTAMPGKRVPNALEPRAPRGWNLRYRPRLGSALAADEFQQTLRRLNHLAVGHPGCHQEHQDQPPHPGHQQQKIALRHIQP